MSLGHGAKIVTSGLVFAYDMGPNPGVNKSWKGKPTTNLVSDTVSQNGWSGSYSLIDSATKTFNVVISRGASTGSAWRSHYWSVSSYIGSSVTISMDVELISENNATFSHTNVGQGNTGSFPYHIAGSDVADRVRVESLPNKTHMTWSGIINSTGVVGISTWINQTVAGGGVTLRISNVQIEANEFETPFVNGTRSNTEALLDWTGNNTITINGLTYNSDGSFDFGGTENSTSDRLTIPNTGYPSNWDDPYSLEAMIFIPTGATWYHVGSGTTIVGRGGYGGSHGLMRANNNAIGFWQRSDTQSRFAGATSLQYDTWYHIVGTNDASGAMKFYLNGNLHSNTALSWTSPAVDLSSWLIGGGNAFGGQNGLYGQGKIPIVRLYNKTLTADEVKTNFNALRGRYGI